MSPYSEQYMNPDHFPFPTLAPEKIMEPSQLGLINRLCNALDESGIVYCHWKSNAAIDRSESGENDLDLLVSRPDLQKFREILFQLDFKECLTDPLKTLPGVQDFVGCDFEADRLIHVHAHYQLILGHDLSKNYRLPVEKPYLESAIQNGLFKVPIPEFELIIFVIRMVIKHATWFAFLFHEWKLSKNEKQELEYLLEKSDTETVQKLLTQHFPYIDHEIFFECLRLFNTKASILKRIRTGRRLLSLMETTARRSAGLDFFVKISRRFILIFKRRILKQCQKFSLANGGAIIAILGGDGAGKTTAIDELYRWLSKDFEIKKSHMGKPQWSLTTILVRTIIRIGRTLGFYPFMNAPFQYSQEKDTLIFPGYPWIIREILTARDRYHTYIKIRRFANNGGLILSDRFPFPGIQLMDCAQAERMTINYPTNRLLRFLIKIEKKYYSRIQLPEIILVLKADPKIAVQRKIDEAEYSVYARSKEIWDFDWSMTSALVVDANQPKEKVLDELKKLIWANI